MLSLFRRNRLREAAALAYQQIVAQARRPAFFLHCQVPDTVDGRFELICLHAFLYLHRLKGEPSAAEVAQLFFDAMFGDFDRSLREMGTGDLSVGRQIQRMAQAFYGRIDAYQRGLNEGDSALQAALARNLFGTAPASDRSLAVMAAYLRREAAGLEGQDTAALAAGEVSFGAAPGEASAAEPGARR